LPQLLSKLSLVCWPTAFVKLFMSFFSGNGLKFKVLSTRGKFSDCVSEFFIAYVSGGPKDTTPLVSPLGPFATPFRGNQTNEHSSWVELGAQKCLQIALVRRHVCGSVSLVCVWVWVAQVLDSPFMKSKFLGFQPCQEDTHIHKQTVFQQQTAE